MAYTLLNDSTFHPANADVAIKKSHYDRAALPKLVGENHIIRSLATLEVMSQKDYV